MVAKFCSRSHGQPVTGVLKRAMISIRREISREGVMKGPGPKTVRLYASGEALIPVEQRRFPPVGPGGQECYWRLMHNESQETALVLFSGGQDSATCLAWALQRFARV